MTTRREFVQAGLAAGALPAVLSIAGPADALAQPTPRFDRVLVDSRFPDSLAFGRETERLGERVQVFDGDITRLWFNELSTQWREAPRPLAGLTAPNVLFILEQFGRDHDMRVVWRAQHHPAGAGVEHRLAGPEAIVAQADVGAGAWSQRMAQLAAACPLEPGTRAECVVAAPAARLVLGHDEPWLVSWVIAPVNRA